MEKASQERVEMMDVIKMQADRISELESSSPGPGASQGDECETFTRLTTYEGLVTFEERLKETSILANMVYIYIYIYIYIYMYVWV